MPQSLPVTAAPRTVGLFALCCLGVMSFAGQANAQTTAPPSSASSPESSEAAFVPTPIDDVLALTNLDVAAHEMRSFLKKIRVVAIKYHLSETPRESRDLSAEWRKMLANGHVLHDKLIKTAIADFKEKPDLESKAGKLLMVVTGRNAEVDRIDNMFEAVQLLKDHGAEGKAFNLCYGITAAGNNQFAAAKPHLELAAGHLEESAKELAAAQKVTEEERKMVAEKMFETYELVKDLAQDEMYEKLWHEELKAREADAAGEPLPRVLIETSKGDIVVELFENNCPNTVANFIELCDKGFYNGLPFHRVIGHFMAQGGDPARDGSGGPGYRIATELNGKTDRSFFRGTLGMAMSGQPDSGGSQFFICYLPRAYLNGKYVAFGRVVEGMNIVSDLAHINPDKKNPDPEMQQTWPDDIVSTKVLSKRAHAYKVNKLPEPKPQPAAH